MRLSSEVSTTVPTKVSNKDFFSAAEPPERSQRNHWSDSIVILLNFRMKKYWRTIHEYLVLKRGFRSHFSRFRNHLSRKKKRDKPGPQRRRAKQCEEKTGQTGRDKIGIIGEKLWNHRRLRRWMAFSAGRLPEPPERVNPSPKVRHEECPPSLVVSEGILQNWLSVGQGVGIDGLVKRASAVVSVFSEGRTDGRRDG